MRRISALACVLIALGMVIGRGPAVAQPSPTIGFADIGALKINIDGQKPVFVVNNTGTAVKVEVNLDLEPGSAGITVATGAGRQTIPGHGSLQVIVKASGAAAGWLVVTDLATDLVIRRAVKSSSLADITPSVTSWNPTVSIGPTQDSANLDPIPLDVPTHCSTAEKLSATLANSGDVATVTGTCRSGGTPEAAVLDLTVSNLDAWKAGTYKGTLSVGGTDVAIEFTRRASFWWLLWCLLAGIAVAVLIRGYVGRRPIVAARRQVDGLTKPTGPDNWKRPVSAAVEATKKQLDDAITDQQLWGIRRYFVIRWWLVPSAAATAKLTASKADVDTARGVLEQWRQSAESEFRKLTKFPDWPVKLAERADVIAGADPLALTEPAEPKEESAELGAPEDVPGKRTGVVGLAAVLAEAKALNAVAQTYDRLRTLQSAVRVAQPPQGTALERHLWQRVRVEAEMAINAALEEIRRAVDAVQLMADGLTDRVRSAVLLVDRLVISADVFAEGYVQNDTDSESDTTTAASWWQLWPAVQRVAVRFGHAVAARGQLLGDLLVLLINLVVVVGLGFTTLYVGKSWGTPADMIGALLGGAGGTLVITPLLAALDRLGGAEPEGKQA